MTRHSLSDLDYLPLWPLVIALEDCYVPETAALALEVADMVGVETLGAQCVIEARYAMGQLTRN